MSDDDQYWLALLFPNPPGRTQQFAQTQIQLGTPNKSDRVAKTLLTQDVYAIVGVVGDGLEKIIRLSDEYGMLIFLMGLQKLLSKCLAGALLIGPVSIDVPGAS